MYRFRRSFLVALSSGLCVAAALGQTRVTVEQPDPYIWLEDVNGPRALTWVKTENDRTAKVLETDSRFSTLEAIALKVLESPDRLALPEFREGTVYNTWQDAQHVRGILRKTTLADYRTAQPHWQTVIDYDALAKTDNEKWVQKGLNCLYPGDALCLAGLSAGGEDAETVREFDLKTASFLPSGFVLPKSKQDVTWVDKDTLLVARDWGAGSMTKSGYPFIVKRWTRSQPLDQAREIFRGAETDVSAGAFHLDDAQGHSATFLQRGINFFENEVSLLTADGVKRLGLPGKSQINALLDGQLVVTLNEDWKPQERTIP